MKNKAIFTSFYPDTVKKYARYLHVINDESLCLVGTKIPLQRTHPLCHSDSTLNNSTPLIIGNLLLKDSSSNCPEVTKVMSTQSPNDKDTIINATL